MNISVYIPSIPQDFKNTPQIAQAYLSAPVKPSEIVICLSGADQADQTVKEQLRQIPNVRLHEHKEWLMAGPNRNLAREYCSGDIIAYQDADDLPHPLRLQVCSKYFEQPGIMVLNHGYIPTALRSQRLNTNNLYFPIIARPPNIYAAYFPHGNYSAVVNITKTYGRRIPRFKAFVCTGAPFIRREVLDHVQWRHPDNLVLRVTDNPHYGTERRFAEDYEFCMECVFKLKQSMIISSPLYYVRKF